MCKGCECYIMEKVKRFVDIYVKCTFSFCFDFSLRVCLSSVWLSCNITLCILFIFKIYLIDILLIIWLSVILITYYVGSVLLEPEPCTHK